MVRQQIHYTDGGHIAAEQFSALQHSQFYGAIAVQRDTGRQVLCHQDFDRREIRAHLRGGELACVIYRHRQTIDINVYHIYT